MVTDALHRVPAAGEVACRPTVTQDASQCIIERHLVIQVVKTAIKDIAAVECHVINFGDKDDFRINLLDLPDRPVPEGHRHHVRHVAAEAVNPLASPEPENVKHPCPRGRDGVEMGAAVPRVDAVVEFHGLVPVVTVRRGGVAVIACRSGGKLAVSLGALSQVNTAGRKLLTCNVVEIVLWVKEHHRVVALAQVFNVCWFGVALILACHVVGHKVDDDFEARFVGALHQGLKLLHAVFHLDGKVGTHVIIVADGVWGTRLAFHDMGVARCDALP